MKLALQDWCRFCPQVALDKWGSILHPSVNETRDIKQGSDHVGHANEAFSARFEHWGSGYGGLFERGASPNLADSSNEALARVDQCRVDRRRAE
jgi:hypothetical protein